MPSDCLPEIKFKPGEAHLAAAVEAALPARAASEPSAFPRSGDLIVTLARTMSTTQDLSDENARLCVTATWHDAFGDVGLALPAPCVTAAGGSSNAAKAKAEQLFIAKESTFARDIADQVKTVVAARHSCELRSKEPLSQLFVKIGDHQIGPFDGTSVRLDCLPTNNLATSYRVGGTELSYSVSSAMCEKPVSLPGPAPGPGSGSGSGSGAGSGSGSGSGSGDGHSGDGHMTQQQWFAGISGVVFIAFITFILARNMFNQTPMNRGVERFLRILIALFGAAFAGVMTGYLTIHVETGGLAIQAGAGLGVGVMLYFFDPPGWGRQDAPPAGDLVKVEIPASWTLQQAIAKVVQLGDGVAAFEGFAPEQLSAALGTACSVQGANAAVALQQLNALPAVKTKFAASYDPQTSTYRIRPA